MLLTITTTHRPATDLGYLLHKHPARVQEAELSVGVAHVFYPEVADERCTIALLLDIDPVALVRRGGSGGNDFTLQAYVNDRPYVASSFLSAAIAKAFSSALNGRCKDKPELVNVPLPLEVRLSVLPVSGGEPLLRQLFEPLGYEVDSQRHALDPAFPEWGESRYFSLTLRHTITMQQLLSHLYVLIPVCDNDKHYWVGEHEVEKLLEKGKDWLAAHPLRELITQRYLKFQKGLTRRAFEQLLQAEDAETDETETKPVRAVHEHRLRTVADELLATGARRVADLGCGEGKLLRMLLAEKQFDEILGMDVSHRALEAATERLKLEQLPPRQKERIRLIQGSLTYRDRRLEGFDAAALVEVIEHLDEPRLAALERVLFECARPGSIVITTPNAEYNVRFPNLEEGRMRHGDHRFEWTRDQFRAWGDRLAEQYDYTVSYKAIGDEDPEVGSLSQMAVFKKRES